MTIYCLYDAKTPHRAITRGNLDAVAARPVSGQVEAPTDPLIQSGVTTERSVWSGQVRYCSCRDRGRVLCPGPSSGRNGCYGTTSNGSDCASSRGYYVCFASALDGHLRDGALPKGER